MKTLLGALLPSSWWKESSAFLAGVAVPGAKELERTLSQDPVFPFLSLFFGGGGAEMLWPWCATLPRPPTPAGYCGFPPIGPQI